ncbi:MAG: hypothetical protein ABW118_08555 [Candidatus Thiodiazotropha sp.]
MAETSKEPKRQDKQLTHENPEFSGSDEERRNELVRLVEQLVRLVESKWALLTIVFAFFGALVGTTVVVTQKGDGWFQEFSKV